MCILYLYYACKGPLWKDLNILFYSILNKKKKTKKKKKKKKRKKKRNNRPPRIFKFKGKMLILPGPLLYDSHSWDIRVYHANKTKQQQKKTTKKNKKKKN